MRVAVMAYEGCLASGVSGFADALAVGNHLAGREIFRVRIIGASESAIRGFREAPVPVDATLAATAASGAVWDVVFVPPAFGVPGSLSDLAPWLRSAHAGGALVCAACAGVFALAEAGILHGREATTHWALAREFRQRFASARLDVERIVIDGGDYVCAAGVTAYFDLALGLIARFVSPETAAACAKTLLLDPGRSSQVPYMRLLAPVSHGDAAIAAAQAWMEDNIQRPLESKVLAEAAHLGERTFLRRFKRATGKTPKDYVRALRAEFAKQIGRAHV